MFQGVELPCFFGVKDVCIKKLKSLCMFCLYATLLHIFRFLDFSMGHHPQGRILRFGTSENLLI